MDRNEDIDEHFQKSLLQHLPFMSSFSNLEQRNKCEECQRWTKSSDHLAQLCDKHRCKRCSQGMPIEGSKDPDVKTCQQCQLQLIFGPQAENRPPGHSVTFKEFSFVEETLHETAETKKCGEIRTTNPRPANAGKAGETCGKEATYYCVFHKMFLCKGCYRPHKKRDILAQSDDDDDEDDLQYLTVDEFFGRATLDGHAFIRAEDMILCYQHKKDASHYCESCERPLCSDCELLHRSTYDSEDSHKIKKILIAIDDKKEKLAKDRKKHEGLMGMAEAKRASNDKHLSRMREMHQTVKKDVHDTYDEVLRRLTADRDALLKKLDEGQKWIEEELGQENERLGDAYLAVATTELICGKMQEGNQVKQNAGLIKLHRFLQANKATLRDYFGENVREHTSQVLAFLRYERRFVKNEHVDEAMTENDGKGNLLGRIPMNDLTIDLY